MSLPKNKKVYLVTSGTFHFSLLNQELMSLGNNVTFIADTPSKAFRSIANIMIPFTLILIRLVRNILRRYFFKSDRFAIIDYFHTILFGRFVVQHLKSKAEHKAIIICSSSFSYPIFRKLKILRPDLFLILDHGSHSLGYELRQLNKCAKVLGCSLQDLGIEKKRYLKQIYIFRKEVAYSDQILLLSKKSAMTICSQKKYTVRSNKSLTKLKRGIFFTMPRKHKPNIGFVGTGSALKGVSIFLAILLKINLPISIIIIGPMIWSKQNKKLVSLLQESNLELIFLGRKHNQYVLNKYKELDVVIFPTLSDGYGLAIEEAFLAGVHILTSKYAGISDRISGFQGVKIFDPLDTASFENEIRLALEKCSL